MIVASSAANCRVWRSSPAVIQFVIGLALSAAAALAAPTAPAAVLPGVSTEAELASSPLKPADVQLYLKIMRATAYRCEHPPPKDVADLAEYKRLIKLTQAATEKYYADVEAGKKKAMSDLVQPTPAQESVMKRGEALTSNGLAQIVAVEAGVPADLWSSLRADVEAAADTKPLLVYGSADDNPNGLPEAQLRAQKERLHKLSSANRELVAPNAPEIRKL